MNRIALLLLLFAGTASAQSVKTWTPPAPDSSIAGGNKITRSIDMFIPPTPPRGYNDIYGNDATFVSANNQIMVKGILKNWNIVALSNDDGLTNTDTLTVIKNDTATTLKVILWHTNTASDLTHTVTFVAGDRGAIRVSDGSNNARYKWTFEFDPK